MPPPFEAREHGDYPGLVLEGEEAEYRIGVGDMIGLRVQRHPEFEGEVKVGPSGKVTLPLSLDRVDVAGLTVGEAEARVAEAIRPYVRLAPKVRLEIARPDSRFVYVLGAVARPGKLSVRDEQVFVREAVVRAGLPLRTAALRRTKLVSSTPDYHASRKIDLNAILYGGDLRENYELKPGDIVWVPRSFVSEIVWHAKQVLEPFAVLIGMDSTATRLSKVPTLDATGGDGNDN
ncbi:polysaccharide export protein [Candidatus Sumerlaeota bacterium]|nr:polysaccharide export protein [Candidatus Sumerlaeota bacterium]